MPGKLYVVGTPIGNREDITLRALKVLSLVDIVLCEDTRETQKLLGMYEDVNLPLKGKQLVRFDDAAEHKMVDRVIAWINEGKNIALVSDAGMPLVSDPGFMLLRQCRKENVAVEVVPGASALTAAMAVAGVPVNQVLFLGFLPEKAGKRMKLLEEANRVTSDELRVTTILYESPYHLRRTVQEIGEVFTDAEIVLCGELTKMYEKVLRGNASELLSILPEKIKGEWVVLVYRS